MFENKTIQFDGYGGHFAALELLKVFSLYEWIIIFIIGFIVFKYFGKYFIIEDDFKNK